MVVLIFLHVGVRNALVDMLSLVGFDVETFGPGEEAMSAMRRHRPNLIVLDAGPGDSGAAGGEPLAGVPLLREIRADPQLRGVPVYLVGADERLRAEAVALGVYRFTPKPVNLGSLIDAIESLDAGRPSVFV